MRKKFATIISTILLCVLWGIIFILYRTLIIWTQNNYILIISDFFISIIGAYMFSLCSIKASLKCFSSKTTILVRFITTLIIVIVGYIISRNNFAMHFLNQGFSFGPYISILVSILFNFYFYIIISVFSCSYIFFEYLHINCKHKNRSK